MASRGINKVILIGNLGQDPEVRYMPGGNAVTSITLATSDTWRDKQTGEAKERYTTEVLVDSFTGVMQMLGGSGQNGGGKQQAADSQQRPTPQPAQSPAYTEQPIAYDDDLPF